MYGSVVEALDLTPDSSTSFLNVGSGTGYLSCVVASILGKTSVCYGIELKRDALDHCMASMERWKATGVTDLPLMEFVHGNGLNIDCSFGESKVGYDRIYVGAALVGSYLPQLASLLRIGGVLVAPGKCSWYGQNGHTHL